MILFVFLTRIGAAIVVLVYRNTMLVYSKSKALSGTIFSPKVSPAFFIGFERIAKPLLEKSWDASPVLPPLCGYVIECSIHAVSSSTVVSG